MAYVPTNQDDEEAKRRDAAGSPPGSFGDTTPTSTPTKTNFVNVGDYLGKNPDASTNLGNLASSKLESQRNEAQGSLDQAKSGFGQQVEAGGQKLDNGFLSSALASPETFTQDPNNVARFHALRDASYQGPSSVQESNVFAPTQSKMTALNNTAQGIGTEAGRTNLVEGLSSHPTHGKSALNQLILQGNPAAAQKISDTAGTFKSVDDQWQKFLTEAPNQVSQVRQQTDDARNATRAGLNTATDAFTKQLSDQTTKAANERDAFNLNYQNIDNAIAGGGSGLTAQQLKDMGIEDAYPYIDKLKQFNEPRGLSYYGSPVQLSNYEQGGSLNSNMPTMGGVASSEQYAREKALQELSGRDLGLADEKTEAYSANGKLPGLDYMGAFNKAGTDLMNFDKSWQPKVAGYGPDDIAQLAVIQGRQGLGVGVNGQPTSGTPSTDYYTNPTAGAAAGGGYQIAPPPEGWNPSQPVPYPQPTSNPPAGLNSPTWNPYTGTWQGVYLQGTGGNGGGAIR